MTSEDLVQNIQSWLEAEGLAPKVQEDERTEGHWLLRYPPGPHGHMFAVVKPKGRDLVAVSSFTRVDLGQQQEMTLHIKEDIESWMEWLHDMRLTLTGSGVDWAIHVGSVGDSGTGPLQAFNVSLPIWLDGLNKNELMQSMRRLWLAKLALIHDIKHHHGPGIGQPGPVDDLEKKRKKSSSKTKSGEQVETDESGSFGSGFDPSEWV